MSERIKLKRNPGPMHLHFIRRTAPFFDDLRQRFGSRQHQRGPLKKLPQSKTSNRRIEAYLNVSAMKGDDDRYWAPSDKWQPKDPVVPEINMYEVRLLLDQRMQQSSTFTGKR
jgi:hypothetical protein